MHLYKVCSELRVASEDAVETFSIRSLHLQ